MTEPLEALRAYVHLLREREGVRSVRLTRTARAGLASLLATARPVQSTPVARRTAVQADATDGRRLPTKGAPEKSSTPPPPVKAAPSPAPVAKTAPTTFLTAPPAALLEAITLTGSSKVEQLAHLGARASICVKCPHLAARRHTVVFGVGNPEAALMFVGEGPGEEEDLQGEPFVGRAGQLLTKMITAMGLSRAEVYIANIVKCRPDMPEGATGNRKPTKQEMETCLPYLRAQIDVIQPRVLVALGATAIEGLLGATGPMGGLRGKFLEYRGIALMPTYHPSYLLRNQSNTEKRKVWEDLLQVMERLGMGITDKQRGFFLGK